MKNTKLYKIFLNQHQPLNYYFFQLKHCFPKLLKYECWWILSVWTGECELTLKVKINEFFSFFSFKVTYTLDKLTKGVELPFIFGHTFYGSYKFYLDQECFLPRPDSAYLVDLVIKKLNKLKFTPTIIYDLCCNIGNLGILVACHFKNVFLYGSDINKIAIKYAKLNGSLLLENGFDFFCDDFLDGIIKQNITMDLLLCNPPYIPFSQKKNINQTVLNSNPNSSLFAPDDGFYFYQEILNNYCSFTKKRFLIGLEINPYHYKKLNYVLRYDYHNLQYEFFKDLQNNFRFLVIYHD